MREAMEKALREKGEIEKAARAEEKTRTCEIMWLRRACAELRDVNTALSREKLTLEESNLFFHPRFREELESYHLLPRWATSWSGFLRRLFRRRGEGVELTSEVLRQHQFPTDPDLQNPLILLRLQGGRVASLVHTLFGGPSLDTVKRWKNQLTHDLGLDGDFLDGSDQCMEILHRAFYSDVSPQSPIHVIHAIADPRDPCYVHHADVAGFRG
jgi:hypothetical protein